MGGVVFTNGTATVTVAFVGAVVAALSWLGKSAISAVVWYHGRRTREMEMIVALVAEIETAVGSLELYSTRKTADDIAGRTTDLHRTGIHLRPVSRHRSAGRTILEVVRFYDGIGAFDTLVASFQEPRFESFPADRRMLCGYMVTRPLDLPTAERTWAQLTRRDRCASPVAVDAGSRRFGRDVDFGA